MKNVLFCLLFLFACLLLPLAGCQDSGTNGDEDAGQDAGADAGGDSGMDAGVDAGGDTGGDADGDVGGDSGGDGGSPVLTRDSIHTDGTEASWECYSPSISGDGRYVTFDSQANSLVTGDSNLVSDVFLHDRATEETFRISVSSEGTEADDDSRNADMSADGRFVVFSSEATNLVPSDTNEFSDIFVHDRQSGQTTRVSMSASDDQADDNSYDPAITPGGRYVVFDSGASTLVAADSNNEYDIFLHDRQTGEIERVSVDSAGTQGNRYSFNPSVSADGRYVAFESLASNLVEGDTNEKRDIFVHDRQEEVTTRVSIDSAGGESNDDSNVPHLDASGRYVVFLSAASNLVEGDTNDAFDVFLHDRQTGQTSRVSVASDGAEGDGASYHGAISSDGRYVAYSSEATNLVAGDENGVRDVFLHDLQTAETRRVSLAPGLEEADGASDSPSIDDSGAHVTFRSSASNLVDGDENGMGDIFTAPISP